MEMGRTTCCIDTDNCKSSQCIVTNWIRGRNCPYTCRAKTPSEVTAGKCCPGGNCPQTPTPGGGGGGGGPSNPVNPPPPVCNPSPPLAATIRYPSHGLILPHNFGTINLSWHVNGWGNGCPNRLKQEIWIYTGTCALGISDRDISTAPNIPGTWYKRYETGHATNAVSFGSHFVSPGRTYCWVVAKSNGYSQVNSALVQFSVASPPPPIPPVSTPTVTPTCVGNKSGFNISWSGGRGPFWIDIKDSPSIPGYFWNHSTGSQRSYSGSADTFKLNYYPPVRRTNTPFSITPGKQYYVDIYDANTRKRSGVTTFTANLCSHPAPTLSFTCRNRQTIVNSNIPSSSNSGFNLYISSNNRRDASDYSRIVNSSNVSVPANTFRLNSSRLSANPGSTYYAYYFNRQYSQYSPVGGGAIAPKCNLRKPSLRITCDANNRHVVNFNNLEAGQVSLYTTGNNSPVYSLSTTSPNPITRTLTLTPGGRYYVTVRGSHATSPNSNTVVAPVCARCGDGRVNQSSEQCDNGARNGRVCNLGSVPGSSCTYCTGACTSITKHVPKGYLDSVTCSGVSGWTCDADDYNSPVLIDITSPTFSNPILGRANLLREAAVGARCGGNRNHGFNVPLPSDFIDGTTKQVFVHARNQNGPNPLLVSPKTIDTSTCNIRPQIRSVSIGRDVCGKGYSGSKLSLSPVTNPLTINLSVAHLKTIKAVELYLVPKTNNDGAKVSSEDRDVVTRYSNTSRDNIRTKAIENRAIMISVDPSTGKVKTFDKNNNIIEGNLNQILETNAAKVSATVTGNPSNPNTTFTIEFKDQFPNGKYNIYYSVSDIHNASQDNNPSTNIYDVKARKFREWGVDTAPPQVVLFDPNFTVNSEYTVERRAQEPNSPNQSGLDLSKTRAYLYSTNAAASYQYKPSVDPNSPFQNVNLIRSIPNYPAQPSNINNAINATFTFKDLNTTAQIPVSQALYVSDNACNTSVSTQNITATTLTKPWLMSVGGAVSASKGTNNLEIPDSSIDIPNVYSGQAALSSETVITGNDNLPSSNISIRNNVLSQYKDNAISVPVEANYKDWYKHMLDRVQRNSKKKLTSAGNVTLSGRFSTSSLFSNVTAFSPNQLNLLQQLEKNNAIAINPKDLVVSNKATFQSVSSKRLCFRCDNNSCVNAGEFDYFCDADYGLYHSLAFCNAQTNQCNNVRPPKHNQPPTKLRCYRTISSPIGNNCEEGVFAEKCPVGWSTTSQCASIRSNPANAKRVFSCTTNPYDDHRCAELMLPNNFNPSYPVFNSLNECTNAQVCEVRQQNTTCYQCTPDLADSNNSCNQISVLGSTCPNGWSDKSTCQNNACTTNTKVCFKCTDDKFDSENSLVTLKLTGTQSCQDKGLASSISELYGKCPRSTYAYRCTTETNDGNTCERYEINYTDRASHNLDPNCSLGGACPVDQQVSCSKCTDQMDDANTCQNNTFTNSCPSGWTLGTDSCNNCPAQVTCSKCTDQVDDANTCQNNTFTNSCPSGWTLGTDSCNNCPYSNQITCYRCSSQTDDGNTCEPFTSNSPTCPDGSSISPTECHNAIGGACPINQEITCSRCTSLTDDAGKCENRLFNNSCPSGWGPGVNTCSSCPAQIACSKCTDNQNDGNACENNTFNVSSSDYNCPAGWVNGVDTCSTNNSCLTTITCYRCTANLRDGDACESFPHKGSICPSGSTETPDCKNSMGNNSCPFEVDCYRCTGDTDDGNACERFSSSSICSKIGASDQPNGCSSAVGGSCLTKTTCYRCSRRSDDGNNCEFFKVDGTTCPTGSSTDPTGCHTAVGGSCPVDFPLKSVMVDNLTIRSGSVCDEQAVIFVTGNLTIDPDLTNLNNRNGCIFIVQGNVTVNNGQQKTNTGITSDTPSEYDIIEGFFIVNGTFTTTVDSSPGDASKWDGLMIKGGLYSKNLELKRNLNENGNGNLRPAHLFVHDGRYKRIHYDYFKSRFYSLRQSL